MPFALQTVTSVRRDSTNAMSMVTASIRMVLTHVNANMDSVEMVSDAEVIET